MTLSKTDFNDRNINCPYLKEMNTITNCAIFWVHGFIYLFFTLMYKYVVVIKGEMAPIDYKYEPN